MSTGNDHHQFVYHYLFTFLMALITSYSKYSRNINVLPLLHAMLTILSCSFTNLPCKYFRDATKLLTKGCADAAVIIAN